MSYTGAELPYDVLATIARALTESATHKECVGYALVCEAFREGIRRESMNSLRQIHSMRFLNSMRQRWKQKSCLKN